MLQTASPRRLRRRGRTLKVEILQRGGLTGSHEALKSHVETLARRLMSPRMVNLLTIRVSLRATKLDADCLGQVMLLANGCKSKRKFDITVQRDDSLTDQKNTLAHELAHVSQIAKGRLQLRQWKTDRTNHVRWEGRDMGRFSEQHYRTSPWEVEAREFERSVSPRSHRIYL